MRFILALIVGMAVWAYFGVANAHAAIYDYDFDTPTTGSGLSPYFLGLSAFNSGVGADAGSVSSVQSFSAPNSFLIQPAGSLVNQVLNGYGTAIATSTQIAINAKIYVATTTLSTPTGFNIQIHPLGIGIGNTASSTSLVFFSARYDGSVCMYRGNTMQNANQVACYSGIFSSPGWYDLAYYFSGGEVQVIVNGNTLPSVSTYVNTFDYIALFRGGRSNTATAQNATQWFVDDLIIYTDADTLTGDIPVLNFDSVHQTRFLDGNVTGSSTDIYFNIEYFISSSEINANVSALNPTMLSFNGAYLVEGDNTILGGQRDFLNPYVTNVATTTTLNWFGMSPLADGNYEAYFNFSNPQVGFGGDVPFPRAEIYLNFTISGGLVTSSSVSQVTDTTVEGVFTPQVSCIRDPAQCIINVFGYLFIPGVDQLQQFTNAWQGLINVKPFGYVTQVIELRGNLSTTTPNVNLPDLPLQTAIFDPIRAGVAVIVWVLFLFYLYNRFTKLEI